jgi:hypothetical protein
LTRYRIRALGDHSGLSAQEFDTPEAMGVKIGREFGAMQGGFIAEAVEEDGTGRELTDAEEARSTRAFEDALSGVGVEVVDAEVVDAGEEDEE